MCHRHCHFHHHISFRVDLNVLDWSSNGHLAVALGGTVYILNTSSGGISQLFDDPSESAYVSSLTWNKNGKYLAIGSSNTDVQVRTGLYILYHYTLLVLILILRYLFPPHNPAVGRECY